MVTKYSVEQRVTVSVKEQNPAVAGVPRTQKFKISFVENAELTKG